MDNSKIAQKMQRQIEEFWGILFLWILRTDGLPKVSQRLARLLGLEIGEAIYGIQARGSGRLTEIGRALHEKISLHKTQDSPYG